MSAIDVCLDHNARYATSFHDRDLPVAPARQLAVVACMDARIDVGALLGLEDGEAHVIRNAGGIVTEDVLRSLTLSQRLLGTREIMLIHHTGCGMQTFTDAELRDDIERETGVRPPFAMGPFTNLDDALRRAIREVAACAFLPHRDAIRAFAYEIETGRLREVC